VSSVASRTWVYGTLAGLVLLGAAARVGSALFDRPIMPDEYFQYLEPAWWHLTGNGTEAWEWHEGLRSWVLPFFNGAFMALCMGLGVRDGATLGTLAKVQWALINAGLTLIAWRAGSSLARTLLRVSPAPDEGAAPAGWQGGLLAAGLCAGFGLLVIYGGHALSEPPSMLCLVSGLMLSAELCEWPRDERSSRVYRRAAWSGALLSLGACLRIANGPLTLLPPLWLLCTGRFRALGVLLAAAFVPALMFGLVDLVTWGGFASSFVAYVKFNLVQGGAARFGTEDTTWYLRKLWQTLPYGLPLLGAAALCGLRGAWPYFLTAAVMLGYLSREPHKEARFILAVWPLLLIAAAGTLGAWIARAAPRAATPAGRWRRLLSASSPRWAVALAVVFAVLADGARNTQLDHWLEQDRIRAHAWVGQQSNVTGALIDVPIFTSGGPWFNQRAPQVHFDAALLSNPLFSHVVARAGMYEELLSRHAGFEPLHREGTFVVLVRPVRAELR
jgi:GPI mannosyltransferase 3